MQVRSAESVLFTLNRRLLFPIGAVVVAVYVGNMLLPILNPVQEDFCFNVMGITVGSELAYRTLIAWNHTRKKEAMEMSFWLFLGLLFILLSCTRLIRLLSTELW